MLATVGRAVLCCSDVLQAGDELSRLAGVHAVCADPVRRQLVVRFDPQALAISRIREAMRPLPPRGQPELWLHGLSRAAELVPLLLGLWGG